MTPNTENWFLENAQFDPESSLDVTQQSIQIALCDEYRARATYQKVVDTFGPVTPFVHIIQAEERHIQQLEYLGSHHGVPEITDDWYVRVPLYPSYVENCEYGVVAEIQNIAMYDRLLAHVQTPDVRDMFYRLQACSYNHHLPAMREAVASHTGGESDSRQDEQNGASAMEQIQKLMGQMQQGQLDPSELQKQIQPLLSNIGNEFLLGGVAGALLGAILGGGILNSENVPETD